MANETKNLLDILYGKGATSLKDISKGVGNISKATGSRVGSAVNALGPIINAATITNQLLRANQYDKATNLDDRSKKVMKAYSLMNAPLYGAATLGYGINPILGGALSSAAFGLDALGKKYLRSQGIDTSDPRIDKTIKQVQDLQPLPQLPQVPSQNIIPQNNIATNYPGPSDSVEQFILNNTGSNLTPVNSNLGINTPDNIQPALNGQQIASGEVNNINPELLAKYMEIINLGNKKVTNLQDQLKQLGKAYKTDVRNKAIANIADAVANVASGIINPRMQVMDTPLWNGGILQGINIGSEPITASRDAIASMPTRVEQTQALMGLQNAADDARIKQAQTIAKMMEAQQMGLPMSVAVGLEPKDYAQYILANQIKAKNDLDVARLNAMFGLTKEDLQGQYKLKDTALSGQMAQELERLKWQDPNAYLRAIGSLINANMFDTGNINALLNQKVLDQLGINPNSLVGSQPNGNTGRNMSANDAMVMYNMINSLR